MRGDARAAASSATPAARARAPVVVIDGDKRGNFSSTLVVPTPARATARASAPAPAVAHNVTLTFEAAALRVLEDKYKRLVAVDYSVLLKYVEQAVENIHPSSKKAASAALTKLVEALTASDGLNFFLKVLPKSQKKNHKDMCKALKWARAGLNQRLNRKSREKQLGEGRRELIIALRYVELMSASIHHDMRVYRKDRAEMEVLRRGQIKAQVSARINKAADAGVAEHMKAATAEKHGKKHEGTLSPQPRNDALIYIQAREGILTGPNAPRHQVTQRTTGPSGKILKKKVHHGIYERDGELELDIMSYWYHIVDMAAGLVHTLFAPLVQTSTGGPGKILIRAPKGFVGAPLPKHLGAFHTSMGRSRRRAGETSTGDRGLFGALHQGKSFTRMSKRPEEVLGVKLNKPFDKYLLKELTLRSGSEMITLRHTTKLPQQDPEIPRSGGIGEGADKWITIQPKDMPSIMAASLAAATKGA